MRSKIIMFSGFVAVCFSWALGGGGGGGVESYVYKMASQQLHGCRLRNCEVEI